MSALDLVVSRGVVSGGEVGIADSCESHAVRMRSASTTDLERDFSHLALAAILAAAMRSGRLAAHGLCSGQSWIR
jgi:hypothetical protein